MRNISKIKVSKITISNLKDQLAGKKLSKLYPLDSILSQKLALLLKSKKKNNNLVIFMLKLSLLLSLITKSHHKTFSQMKFSTNQQLNF